MSRALKAELLAVLKGSGRLAQHVEWNRAERTLLKRWTDDWTDNPDYSPLWGIIEADAHKLGGRCTNAGAIFQELIWYTIRAWQIAKGVQSGNDPIERERQKRREHLLDLADAADALAKYYRDNTEFPLGAEELLMPLLKGVKIGLLRPGSLECSHGLHPKAWCAGDCLGIRMEKGRPLRSSRCRTNHHFVAVVANPHGIRIGRYWASDYA
jgi:hypothetical protein